MYYNYELSMIFRRYKIWAIIQINLIGTDRANKLMRRLDISIKEHQNYGNSLIKMRKFQLKSIITTGRSNCWTKQSNSARTPKTNNLCDKR